MGKFEYRPQEIIAIHNNKEKDFVESHDRLFYEGI